VDKFENLIHMKAKIRGFSKTEMAWRNLRLWWKGERQREWNPHPPPHTQGYPPSIVKWNL